MRVICNVEKFGDRGERVSLEGYELVVIKENKIAAPRVAYSRASVK
jgi:hypothetical protein